MTYASPPPKPPAERPSTLSERTMVPVSFVVGALTIFGGTVLGAALWAADVTYQLRDIHETLAEGTDDRWRGDDMRAWVRQANKEVQIWSRAAEQRLDLEPGTWHIFNFPDPDEVRGR